MPNLVGTGLNQVPTNGMLGGLAYQSPDNASIKDLDLKNLSQINSEIANTAADIFVYDTSKDSDGGAWRHRTQHTSWYNETLGTSTRGTRREFPSVAVIVVTAATTRKLYIYDGDDPDLPMWMVIDTTDGQWTQVEDSSLSALNGIIALGSNSGSQPLFETRNRLDLYYFVSDKIESSGGGTGGSYYGTVDGLVNRRTHATNRGTVTGASVYPLLNMNVNCVAMTVLPNAPIDDATGLPVPTIAVGNNSGVSIIPDDGPVTSLTGFNPIGSVELAPGVVIASVNTGGFDFIYKTNIPKGANAAFNADIGAGTNNYYMNSNSSTTPLLRDINVTGTAYDSKNDVLYRRGNNGFDIIKAGEALSNSSNMSAIAYISHQFNTGYQIGDIRAALASDTDDTDKTNGQSDLDRSIKANNVAVFGTITKNPVATGADLVAYSGFNASNNFVQPYTADLNLGTGDFSVIAWIKKASLTTNHYIMDRNDGSSETDRWSFIVNSSGFISSYNGSSGANARTNSGIFVGSSNWRMIMVRRSGGELTFGLDGEIYSSTHTAGDWGTTNISGSGDEELTIGQYGGGSNGSKTFNVDYSMDGIANLRISATAPTPEQFKMMYEDEKVLYRENAKATIYGSSGGVDGLAYDEETGLLHAGTSAGRSEFQGLRRINNTTTAVTTAISASKGLVAEQ